MKITSFENATLGCHHLAARIAGSFVWPPHMAIGMLRLITMLPCAW